MKLWKLLRGYLFTNPFSWMLLEVMFIEFKWGIERINNFNTIEQIGILLLVVIIPAIISIILHLIIGKLVKESKGEGK